MGCQCLYKTKNFDESTTTNKIMDDIMNELFKPKKTELNTITEITEETKLSTKLSKKEIKQRLKLEKKFFVTNLLNEINECRVNPKLYAMKIKQHKQYIIKNESIDKSDVNDKKKDYLFLYDNPTATGENGHHNIKISLSEGKKKFKECIDYLNTLQPLPPLEFCEELCIKVPEDENKWLNKDSLADLLGEKKVEMAERYNSYRFHFDVGAINSEVSAIIQIVDDNKSFKGNRRENILNESITSVGISNFICKRNCVYLLFANKA